MVLYESVWTILAWSITVAILGFVTFPWAILAYKIWHGNTAIDEDLRDELLTRSWYAGWALAAASALILVLDYMIVDWLDLPAGPVHLIAYIGLLSLAGWFMMYFFSMEDFLQGLVLTVLYLYMPAALLCVLSYLFKNPLQNYVLEWLIKPKA